jgi:hypothetical protein
MSNDKYIFVLNSQYEKEFPSISGGINFHDFNGGYRIVGFGVLQWWVPKWGFKKWLGVCEALRGLQRKVPERTCSPIGEHKERCIQE